MQQSLVLPFLGTGMRIDLSQSCGHCWVFQICWYIECSTLIASSFRILNNSVEIPLPPPASLAAVLPKVHLTKVHTPGCLALNERLHHCGYLNHWDLFSAILSCIFSISSWSLLASMGYWENTHLWERASLVAVSGLPLPAECRFLAPPSQVQEIWHPVF